MSKEHPAIEEMRRLTRHNFVQLTDRCNSSIFIAMSIAKKNSSKSVILISDQGGWFSYKKYPKYFGLEVVEVKTDYGIIDLDDLKEKVAKAAAIIFTSFAGYYAEQPLKEISKICHEVNCLVIEDASGAIGDEELCNGNYSDIIVGSFGKWKPIECGYGGFISTNNESYFGMAKEAMSITRAPPSLVEDLKLKLQTNKLNKLLLLQKQVKKDLKEFQILHPDKRGLNVVVKPNPKVIDYCNQKGYPYVECPRYIRVNEKAISIELKRLNL